MPNIHTTYVHILKNTQERVRDDVWRETKNYNA